jgi:multisubunit Na+/H+ antiporter MnhF subunit
MTAAEFLVLTLDIAFLSIIAAVAFAFVRLIRGPSLADRVVALDMMTVLIVAFCGLFAISSGERAFLDVAIVLALVGFLATVALARYAERRMARADMSPEEIEEQRLAEGVSVRPGARRPAEGER